MAGQGASSFPQSHGNHKMSYGDPALPLAASMSIIQAPAAYFRPIVQKKTFKPPFMVRTLISCNRRTVKCRCLGLFRVEGLTLSLSSIVEWSPKVTLVVCQHECSAKLRHTCLLSSSNQETGRSTMSGVMMRSLECCVALSTTCAADATSSSTVGNLASQCATPVPPHLHLHAVKQQGIKAVAGCSSALLL